ncbi:hypothetical protein DL96DRAFT_375652 [Flagelloscypha sp. PMI_526]|nr:hypothetical protein DL96DRAFT_375652 [Flagelloscypha sp. PMI_526]
MPSFSSADHVWSLIKSYEETCRTLRKVQAELAILQNKESQLAAQRTSQLATLMKFSQPAKERVFNMFDLLQQILVYAVEPRTRDEAEDFTYISIFPNIIPTVFAVASVSSMWRQTALRSPNLWRRIDFYGDEDISIDHKARVVHRVQSCLRRSFPLPLLIRWEDAAPTAPEERGPSSWVKNLFEMLTLHSHRWQWVKLRLPLVYYQSLFPLNMPKLEALTVNDTEDNVPGSLSMGPMPLLRSLGLFSPNFSDIGIPWHQLTAVSALDCVGMVDLIFKNCKHLERLHIDPGPGNPSLGAPAPIYLEGLRHLGVCSNPANFPWPSLTVPALEILTIDNKYLLVPQSDALRQFLERCSRLQLLQIRLFQLNRKPTSMDLAPLFETVFSTTVRILQFQLSTWNKHLISFLSRLTLHRLKKQFPALHQIHIDVTPIMSRNLCEDTSIGDAIIHTLLTLSNDIEQCCSNDGAPYPLQMIYLHTSSSHSETNITAPHLQVTTTRLNIDTEGENLFPIGHLWDF